MTVWNFKEQLEIGDRGEQLFLENYPKKLEVWPGRDGDFIEVNSRKKVELKTDTYNINKTENFFIERYSLYNPEFPELTKPGGMWQAKEHGCEIFCYMFVRHNIWFQFNDIPATLMELESLTKGMGLIYIKNHGYVTAGYKIPRDKLKELFVVWEF